MLLALALCLAGCFSSSDKEPGWSGPGRAVPITTSPWTYEGKPGRTIKTEHYAINTTVGDDRFLDMTAQVMEGAYDEYRRRVPWLGLSTQPMECFIFSSRPEWETYTRRNTGPAAAVYLRIMRGGYALGDRYVSYYFGDYNTYSVAAHEGWHQFCGRNFKGKTPPFLEEGIACTFEGLSLSGPSGLPRWNPAVNLNRAVKLRNAVQERRLWPLEQLIRMHAGQVVGSTPDKIDAFYAQSWAFARYLWEFDNGKRRPSFQRMMTDIAAGSVYDPRIAASRPAYWQADATKGILEHYLGIPFAQIEKEYLTFVNSIAFDQFEAQWRS